MSTRNGTSRSGAVSARSRGGGGRQVRGCGLGQRQARRARRGADGEYVLATTFRHDERGLQRCAPHSCGWVWCWSRSSVPMACGRAAARCRLAGHRDAPQPGRGARPRFRPAAGSPIASTRSCSASSRGPTITASVCSSATAMTPKRCARSAGAEDLVQTRVALANQLRAELERFWPGAAESSPRSIARSPWRSLRATPARWTPRLGEKRLATFLARHAYCGRKPAAALLGRLRDAPQGRAGDSETTLAELSCSPSSPRSNRSSRRSPSSRARSRSAFTPIPTGTSSCRSSNPKSVVCAAALLAEIGDCRARYRTAEALAADAGMTPVAVESGNARSHASATDATTASEPRPARSPTRPATGTPGRRYATARPRPDHQRAIRTLGRAWIRVLCDAGKTVPPTPRPHRGLQQHIAVVTRRSSPA